MSDLKTNSQLSTKTDRELSRTIKISYEQVFVLAQVAQDPHYERLTPEEQEVYLAISFRKKDKCLEARYEQVKRNRGSKLVERIKTCT